MSTRGRFLCMSTCTVSTSSLGRAIFTADHTPRRSGQITWLWCAGTAFLSQIVARISPSPTVSEGSRPKQTRAAPTTTLLRVACRVFRDRSWQARKARGAASRVQQTPSPPPTAPLNARNVPPESIRGSAVWSARIAFREATAGLQGRGAHCVRREVSTTNLARAALQAVRHALRITTVRLRVDRARRVPQESSNSTWVSRRASSAPRILLPALRARFARIARRGLPSRSTLPPQCISMLAARLAQPERSRRLMAATSAKPARPGRTRIWRASKSVLNARQGLTARILGAQHFFNASNAPTATGARPGATRWTIVHAQRRTNF
mmetsp:Transcript_29573/g.96302  ORF Transcript_29573/g.96302 Transcript_29573/m.96302 type:complete len:323 (-) Transcript_29573:3239-4207(-)